MKRKLIYVLSTVMIGATLFTGCGANKATNNTTTVNNTPKAVQATKNEVSKQPLKDDKGDALSEDDRQSIADSEKTVELANKTVKEFVETLYNETPDTIDQVFDKLNSLSVNKKGIFGDNTETLKKQMGSSPNKLISYTTDNIEVGKEYTLKDGTKCYGIEESLTVKFETDGQKLSKPVKLVLGYINSSKSFKIIGSELKNSTIIQ